MNIFESLAKRFFKDTENSDTSIVDPTRIVAGLEDVDLASLIHPSMIHQHLKSKPLTSIENILNYRKLAGTADGAVYVEEVVNEIYSPDKEQLPKIKVKDYEIPVSLEKKITEAHEKIMKLLNFRRNGNDLIRQWYVDGHLFLECIYLNNDMKKGIQHIMILDPKGMVKEFNDAYKREIYKYNISSGHSFYGGFNGREYEREQLVHVWSEMKDENDNAIGYLHPALKPGNQMRLIEDMLVVYRITRGGEKRAIKVNVGNMPKAKAISYMSELVNKFRNKRTYNTETGNVDNNSHLMAVTEDLWLPTKNDTKDIDITTLAGGMQLGEMDDVTYFRNKLLTALRIPANRFKEDANAFDISATEITSQEKRFAKYIGALRLKFNQLFIELLKRELISTNSMNEQEFDELQSHIIYVYPDETSAAKKEFYVILNKKLDAISNIDTYVGKYFTEDYIHREILDRNDDEIEEFKELLQKEQESKMKGMVDNGDLGDNIEALASDANADADADAKEPEKKEIKKEENNGK